MSNEILKQKLHELVDTIEDEHQLSMLCEAAEEYIVERIDIDPELTECQYQRLLKSMEQVKEGKTHTNEEVMQMAKKWITK